jgi:hypothetical protein
MTDEQRTNIPEESESEKPSRPPPRNPFASSDAQRDDGIPALIDNRRSAAIYGVVFGLIVLLLVVGLCVASSYAFSS